MSLVDNVQSAHVCIHCKDTSGQRLAPRALAENFTGNFTGPMPTELAAEISVFAAVVCISSVITRDDSIMVWLQPICEIDCRTKYKPWFKTFLKPHLFIVEFYHNGNADIIKVPGPIYIF